MEPEWERAVRVGNVVLLGERICRGTDVNARDRHGQSALMIAAHTGQLEVARLLVASGADLECAAKYRLTPLMLAVIGGHEELALMLARAGADLSATAGGDADFAGKTASDLAADRGLARLALELSPR